ncbi:ATV_HP_G0062980.mRNA.1.CDS.1 [Saccharomyces cerevisiae]|nr:ATV_HP_G0062980.mRNA.1.CDS.1 [Saccharomyces cerevisiae]CAI6999008.1 ATV_HP_G0062980.mRNA.1.CDS.1 [Saccharomyces cerevisiae]
MTSVMLISFVPTLPQEAKFDNELAAASQLSVTFQTTLDEGIEGLLERVISRKTKKEMDSFESVKQILICAHCYII